LRSWRRFSNQLLGKELPNLGMNSGLSFPAGARKFFKFDLDLYFEPSVDGGDKFSCALFG
jgi:hypothetical protein